MELHIAQTRHPKLFGWTGAKQRTPTNNGSNKNNEPMNGQRPKPLGVRGGGLKCILLVLNHRLRLYCCLNTNTVKLPWRRPNLCNVSSQRSDLIKLTHNDETKKGAHDLQIVRAKAKLKLNHDVPKKEY